MIYLKNCSFGVKQQSLIPNDKFLCNFNSGPLTIWLFFYSNPDALYYHREVLCYSLDKLRIELLTVTSCKGMIDEEEPRFDEHLFPEKETKRCKKFRGKRVSVSACVIL